MRCIDFGRKQRSSNFNRHVEEANWITLITQYAELDYVMRDYCSVFNINSYTDFHFPDFTLILNGPFQNMKPRFHSSGMYFV